MPIPLELALAQQLREQGHISDETFALAEQRARSETPVTTPEPTPPPLPEPTPEIIRAIIEAESSGRPDAVSPKGATGLMQVMPATAAEVAAKMNLPTPTPELLRDPDYNKKIGTAYFTEQQKRFGNDELALAAYNAGPGRVQEAIDSAGSNDLSQIMSLLPSETQAYVPKVLSFLKGKADDEIKQREEAYDLQQQAALEGAAAGARKAAEADILFESEKARQDKAMQDELSKQQAEQKRLQDQEERMGKALEEYRSMGDVDSSRFWNSRTTGQKILAGISIFLGAIGGAMAKNGRNPGLEIIQQAIENDIKAQVYSREDKRASTTLERSLYEDMLQRFGSERQARSAARAIATDRAQLELDRVTKSIRSDETIAKAKELYGQLEVQKQKDLADLKKAALEDPQVQAEAREGVVTAEEPTAVDLSKLSEKDRERYVPGLGFATTSQDAKEVKEAQEKYKDLQMTLDEIIAGRKESGAEVVNREAVRTQKSRAAMALLQIKELYKLGALDQGAVKLGGSIIPEDPTEFPVSQIWGQGSASIIGPLEDLKSRLDQTYKERIRTRILQPTTAAKQQSVDIYGQARKGPVQ